MALIARMRVEMHTGGLAATNGYLVEGADGEWLAVDAPEGMVDFCRGRKVGALVLTHGHWDHIWDAAELAEAHGCPVYYHAEDAPLITQPEVMRAFGLPVKLRPVAATRHVAEGEELAWGQWRFQVVHVPGHCPGSICLYEAGAGVMFGGDVLFAGGVGRWDLPLGDRDVLLRGIREKLLVLPEATRVLPGHGPETTIGEEKESNPFLVD